LKNSGTGWKAIKRGLSPPSFNYILKDYVH